jgi:hypothetical protein
MAVLYTNNAVSALSASITSTATSFSVTSGHGVRFPTISGSDYFYVTLYDSANNIEIVKVTGRSTDTFTVVRGQDGTTGLAFSAADKVELRVTKAVLDDIKTDTKTSLTSLNVTTALGFTPLGTSTTDTLTNKRITPRVSSSSSISSPLAWNSDNFDLYAATAQSSSLTINADSGSPTDGQKILFRFEDSGILQSLTWTTGATKAFRAVGVTLPSATTPTKALYVGCVYNAFDLRWDVIAVAQEA